MTRPIRQLDPLAGLLVVVMAVAVAWSIDDARWVLGRPGLTDFLVPIAATSSVFGLVAGWIGWPRWRSHFVGAMLASIVLGVLAGTQLTVDSGPWAAFQASAQSLAAAIRDLVIDRRGVTAEYGHFLLALGAVAWSIGQFLGYGVAGHRQPPGVVVVAGLVLLANVALTVRDQLGVLVVYSIAALSLIARDSARGHGMSRARQGIPPRPLRTATLFIAIAVSLALGLSSVAASAPLAGAWSGLDGRLVELGQALRSYLPAGGGTRLGGVAFGDSTIIPGSWVTDDTIVARVRVSETEHPYWRAVTYDRFTGSGWSWTARSESEHGAADDLVQPANDGWASGLATREVVVEFELVDTGLRTVLSPGPAIRVDKSTRRRIGGEPPAAFVGRIDLASSAGPYRVSVVVPVTDPSVPGALTANRLRAAGDRYPTQMQARYTEILPGSVGPAATNLLEEIRRSSRATNAYDLARAVERYLKDGRNFTYDTDVTDVDCRGLGVVDCFVEVSRRGYCEHYASTMVMLLRLAGVPARLVEGFLPGERGPDGLETIRRNQAHAWVEVFFPETGWVPFDPTGGGVGRDLALPAGPTASAPQPEPTPVTDAIDERDPRQGLEEPGDPRQPSSPTRSPAPPAVVLGLAILLGALVLAVARRRTVSADPPEVVYRNLLQWAARLGARRHPSQTPHEFGQLLGRLVPTLSDDLQLVTDVAVEALYAGRPPASSSGQLRQAASRLRLRLLQLPLIRVAHRMRRPARGR